MIKQYTYFKDDSGLKKNTISVIVIATTTITPFGEFLYPQFVIWNNKALRPLTIDGYGTDGENFIIHCMLSCENQINLLIKMDGKTYKLDKYKHFIQLEAIMNYNVNPFEVTETIEFKDGKIALYHHTSKKAYKDIIRCGYFFNSLWNFQGTNKFSDWGFLYLTDLQAIRNHKDLMKIGMRGANSSIGVVTDDDVELSFKVYREEVENRNYNFKVWVSPELLHLNPIILHRSYTTEFCTISDIYSWIEIFSPNIFRIVLSPKEHISFNKLGKNELELIEDNLGMKIGFLAGLGYKIEDLQLLWNENILERRVLQLEVLAEWKSLWEKNLATLGTKMAFELFKNL